MTNVGVYLRLSLSDSDLGLDNKDESNSIENQRMMIRSYIEKKEEFDGKVIEYVDDGFSGTNFNRPAFKKMIEDAKKGIIQVIIVKDLSRFGRDYLEVGDYLEQILPSLGIRLIALNSNYDSINYIGKPMDLDTSVSNLINTMYSKDLSKKISSSYQSRWKSGINTAGSIPYGYIRDDEKKWEIDPVAGEIVKTIFNMAAEGKGIEDICNYLNERQVPTPGEYLNGLRNENAQQFTIKCKEIRWDRARVYRILKNESYIGTAVHGQRKRLIVGSRVSKKAHAKDMVITMNDHPSIISEDAFFKAQRIIRESKSCVRVARNRPLTGKIFCPNCGLRMFYTDHPFPKIYCSHGLRVGKYSKCKREYYDARIIEAYVFYCLKQQIHLILNLSKEIREEQERGRLLSETTVDKIRQKIKALDIERIRLYEQYANGHVSKQQYISEKEKLNAEKSEQQEKLDGFEKEKADEDSFLFEAERIENRVKPVRSEHRITKELADAYIESVVIHDQYNIEIEFKFEDIVSEMLAKQN